MLSRRKEVSENITVDRLQRQSLIYNFFFEHPCGKEHTIVFLSIALSMSFFLRANDIILKFCPVKKLTILKGCTFGLVFPGLMIKGISTVNPYKIV